MRKIVGSNQGLCVGCNRCTRECPIEMANLTYQDEKGDIKVKVDNTKCIACGACISVCKHDARYYIDDFQTFFDDLSKGVPVSLIVAPSIKTNFPDWRRLLTYLKSIGVRKIYDVSLGADICIWAHLRYIDQFKPASLITQPCAPIVSYCEIHRPELLSNLSPIHSPMGCTAVYMKQYEGITDKIAALSPCIAKANEFEAIGSIDYNVTFAALWHYIENNRIELPVMATDFDHYESGLGVLFPMSGGLKENIEFSMGKAIRIDVSEGKDVYKDLDDYATTPSEQRPQILDVLNCAEGCNSGSGCLHGKNIFEIQTIMNAYRQEKIIKQNLKYRETLYKEYDKAFDLDVFLRRYSFINTAQAQVDERDVQQAFELLDKDTFAKQNFNCGACGSNTCLDMARKIALGINLPLNCIIKSRDDARSEHKQNEALYQRNIKHLAFIRDVGEKLLSIGDNKHADAMVESLNLLCSTMEMHSAHIWKYCEGDMSFEKILSWPVNDEGTLAGLSRGSLPEWFDALPAGKHVIKHSTDAVVLSVPIFIKGKFWGFTEMKSDSQRVFREEEVSVVVSGSMLIVSSIIEKEMTANLITANEEALLATRAKSDFLSRMSHEMRTPMNAIIGMTQIAESTDDISKLRYCLSTIDASSTHLLNLINDILDMSKIEAGKFELDAAPFSIEKMLMNVCRINSSKIETKNQKFGVILDENMPLWYIGDELRLSQVVANLLSNAVKFTPEGGKIRIDVTEDRRNGDWSVLRLSVSDTGIGMTPEQTGRLFNAFEQADKSIARQYGGTGLGLAISKNIIEKMNGSITVQSQSNHGSTFAFEASLLRHRSEELSGSEKNFSLNGKKALIAETDNETLMYIKVMMNKAGIASDTAENSREAADLISTACQTGHPYDVILLDSNMSIDMISNLTDPLDADTVVLMTTFLEWNRLEESAKKIGITRFITKPVFPSAIFDALIDISDKTFKEQQAGINRKTNNLPDLSNVSLLLVDDIEINREIVIALLEGTGAKIDTANDGREAVNKFNENPDRFDLILMDIQMPMMDGYEASREIRSYEAKKAREIPIIAMTANAFKEDVDKCLQNGMSDHIAKPIDAAELLEKLSFYANQR